MPVTDKRGKPYNFSKREGKSALFLKMVYEKMTQSPYQERLQVPANPVTGSVVRKLTQRKHICKSSRTMNQLNELWILLILCVNVKSYTIRYNDCTKPSKVREYRTDSSCKTIPTLNQEKKEIQILQEITDEKVKGYSCSIVTSRFTYY